MTVGTRASTMQRIYDYTEGQTFVRRRAGVVRAVEADDVLIVFDDLVQTHPDGLIVETEQYAWVRRENVLR